MVDVSLVVVNEIPSCTLLCLCVHVPVDLGRELCLVLVLNLYVEVLDCSRYGLNVVVDLELAYIHLVSVVATLNAQTDVLDDVALRNAVESHLHLLPVGAVDVAHRSLYP